MSSNTKSADRKYKVLFYILLGVVGGTALFILFGFVVKVLWNVTIAEMFDVGTITFWQALGLFVLAKLFFGFGIGGSAQGGKSSKGRSRDGIPRRSDETFRAFWRDGGKEAYESYRAGRDEISGEDNSSDEPDKPA